MGQIVDIAADIVADIAVGIAGDTDLRIVVVSWKNCIWRRPSCLLA